MSLLSLADCWPRRFTPSSLALQFCEDPTRAEQPLFAKACAGKPSPSSGRRRRDLWCRGAIVSLRICRRSARILPRAAGRYGSAAPGRSGASGAGNYQP